MSFDIYLDSDGVCCDFSAYCLTHYGKLPDNLDKSEKSKFWSWVQWHNDNVQPFFRNLPKMDGADDLVNFCTTNFNNTKILTASGFTPKNGDVQKIEWYAENYPHVECIVVSKSPDKAAFAHPRAILVDDRAKSIDPWVAAGGIGILHTSVDDTIARLRQFVT